MLYINIREEELKNKIAHDFFWQYDCTKIIGNVDFCVCIHQSEEEYFELESLLWAEAKAGKSDIYSSLVQLILTIGKARTFDKFLPPPFLGAFDAEKIAFIPYSYISEIFYLNDFNWNVAPSNYETNEFKLVHKKVKLILDSKVLLFKFDNDKNDLIKFIRLNFIVGKFGYTKTKIDKNNFMIIYNKWLSNVKPSIAVDWDIAKRTGIIDGDFYLADLLSNENFTLKEKLFVLLKKDHYELDKKLDNSGMFSHKTANFLDKQVAHTQFWNKYDRPPKEEYWDYIVDRRDLLVPQDVRERKGSFYTPQIWVELSQKYIADVLGENWQDEHYVWDCAAGTGNLLNGLTNKYNIWASTLDTQDVKVMKDRIQNGANLLEEHVFQFDFLNDEFSKLPQGLLNIINDPEKRKKLVIYINPPYAEAGDTKQRTGTGKNKTGVSTTNKSYELYKNKIGNASNELFALFMSVINEKLQDVLLAQFSTLKYIQGSNFEKFRTFFQGKFKNGFLVPANTFDNVKGKFPIGFLIWDLKSKIKINNIKCDVYEKDTNLIFKKTIYTFDTERKRINDWFKIFRTNKNNSDNIGYLMADAPDFQNNNLVAIMNYKGERHGIFTPLNNTNIVPATIYLSVRQTIQATWLNDRDQFLYPNDGWKEDEEFKNDCLAYALFHSQNKIKNTVFLNHWIPFTEKEVDAKEKFESNFMTNFIKGKIKRENVEDLFDKKEISSIPLVFSKEATPVFETGRELWKYYHSKPKVNVNASLYDIREYFQGRNDKGKMNNKSTDADYNQLISNLREKLKALAKKIEPKVYEYGFLKE